MRARACTVVAAALLASALADGPPARAAVLGVQDDRLTSGPVAEVPARIALLRASRARVTRLDVLWSLVAPTRPARPEDPGDPAYRWERTDAALSGLARIGVTPILVAYSAPPWAADGRPIPDGTEVNPAAPSPIAFAAFMRALATRYTGRHRPAGAERPLPRVRHFELWNEPNLAAFLSPQVVGGRRVAAARYARMTRLAYPAVKRVQPGAVVLGGAGGPRSSTDARGTGALEWARAVASGPARFDQYSQHVYPAAPPLMGTRAFPSWATLDELFAVLDAVPRRRGAPLVVTEAGYTTAATPFRSVRVTPAQQASYLSQIVRLPVVRSGRIRAIVWFNLQDNPRWPGGLRTVDGRPKPSHAVFRRLARAERVPADLRLRAPIRLTPGQLLVNQRISQAAIRRLAAVERRLDRGLTRDDIRPGGIRAASFAPDVIVEAFAVDAGPPPPLQRRVTEPAPPERRPGAASSVHVSASQLLVNQRVAQAAVRRADALADRLAGGLTGGDLRDGAIDGTRLAPGVRIVGTHTGGAVGPSRTRLRPPGPRAGRQVRLTVAQVAVNQRISQAAVRRANLLALTFAAGITSGHVRPGSLTAAALDPSLRTAAAAG